MNYGNNTVKKYDKVIKKSINGTTVEYGIIFGDEKIVFSKCGSDKGIQEYKYSEIAHRIHERMGATVIAASNPSDEDSLPLDKGIITALVNYKKFTEYSIYYVGPSDGAYKNLLIAKEFPQSVRLLSINSSMIDYEGLEANLLALPEVKKTLIFGSEDELYHIVPKLQALECDNLEIIIEEGADHGFHDMMDRFIELTDLL